MVAGTGESVGSGIHAGGIGRGAAAGDGKAVLFLCRRAAWRRRRPVGPVELEYVAGVSAGGGVGSTTLRGGTGSNSGAGVEVLAGGATDGAGGGGVGEVVGASVSAGLLALCNMVISCCNAAVSLSVRGASGELGDGFNKAWVRSWRAVRIKSRDDADGITTFVGNHVMVSQMRSVRVSQIQTT